MPPKKKTKTQTAAAAAAAAAKKTKEAEKKQQVDEEMAVSNQEGKEEKKEKETENEVNKEPKPETAEEMAAATKEEEEEKQTEVKPDSSNTDEKGEKKGGKKEQEEKKKAKTETAAAKQKKDPEEKKEENVVEKEKEKDDKEKEKVKQKDDNEEEELDAEDDSEKGDGDGSHGKRKRKASTETAFEPEDFTMSGLASSMVKIVQGRGTKLKDFPSVVSSMEKRSHEEVLFAHKFIFGNRGAALKKKELLANLFEFSGYLKKAPVGYDKEKLEAEDEREEERYSKKAYKLILAQVRLLCDIFNILKVDEQTGKTLNKEDTIDNLLDFLAQPHKDFLNPDGSRKSGTPKKASKRTMKPSTTTGKKPTATKVGRKRKYDKKKHYFHLIKDHTFGDKPTDDTLRMWVRAFVHCLNMDKATAKDAIKYATEKFGHDMAEEKERLKALLAEELDPDLVV